MNIFAKYINNTGEQW